jgi:heme/copper-type cytochrome/quinol oxidase subunit 4
MAEQDQKIGIGKMVFVALISLVAVAGYYYFLDYIMMEWAQNLPFPYRPTK